MVLYFEFMVYYSVNDNISILICAVGSVLWKWLFNNISAISG